MTTSVYLCVIRNEMLVYKAFLGSSETADSIRRLLATGELIPIDSWSEIGLTYEKYETEDMLRAWSKIAKRPNGLQDTSKVPTDGSWGFLYE